MPRPLKLGLLQCLSFLLVTVNFRMVAAGFIPGAIGTDVLIMLAGWTLFAQMQAAIAANSWWDRLGYVIGGAIGSTIAMLATGARL